MVVRRMTGTFLMLTYANTPGKAGSTSTSWPESSQLSRNNERPTLIMFMHPHCPCSRASIDELALLMAHCQGRVDAHVLFIQHAAMAPDWVVTDTWREAALIPSVTVDRARGSGARHVSLASKPPATQYPIRCPRPIDVPWWHHHRPRPFWRQPRYAAPCRRFSPA